MASSSHVSVDLASASNAISSQTPSLHDASPVIESWCHTGSKVVKFKFTWTIHDFPLRREKVQEMLESSDFSAGHIGSKELKWSLRAWPKGRKTTEDYFALFLNLVLFNYKCTEFTEFPAKFKLVILNDKCEKALCRLCEHTFTESQCDWGFDKFVKLDSLLNTENGFLPNNNLTIVCEGAVSVDKVNHFELSSECETEIPKCSLPENLFLLFENGEFSDITLSVDGKDIPAHKIILAAQSPVFAAMFKCDMQESKQNRVIITDMKYEVLREMLRYIYTGKSPNLETMVDDLLAAANKYDLSGLKKMCVTVLYSQLTVTNAADLLVLADMHCSKQLKARVISFITMRAKKVTLTPGWKKMSLNYPHVAIEALQALVSHSFP